VNSRANARFWRAYQQLPPAVRTLARKNYRLWQLHPRHPSLRFKKVGVDLWSVRIGAEYRALAAEEQGVFIWFWIGPHDEYQRLLQS
jgi:hypothetical protein